MEVGQCVPIYPRARRLTARTVPPPAPVASHPEQGWSLLCNGVIVFDDMGEILPGGVVTPPPHRMARSWLPAAA